MPQPIILLVADDGRLLDGLTGDLERRFGSDYQVQAERSPAAGLAAMERLAGGDEPVALVVAARRMEGTDGLGLLERAHELHPGAKRVLLEHRGEWTSGEPVVRAMTLGQVDYVLFRPWLPREQFLYLPVSEFLAAWEKSLAPSPEAIQIVGRRWAARSHQLRDALARVGIPYGFYPDDSPAGRRLLDHAGEDGSRLPVVLFRRGRALADPTDARRLRRPDRRGRAGRAGRGRLRRLRGVRHPGPGAGRPRRPGRHQLPDPQLPGLPLWGERRRADHSGHAAGVAVRGRPDPRPGRHRPAGRRPGPGGDPVGRRRGRRPGGDLDHRGGLAAPGRARP